MNYALIAGTDAIERNMIGLNISFDRPDHFLGQIVKERTRLIFGGDDVIDRGKGALGESDFQAQIAKHAECLGAGHFMDKMGTDQQLGGAIGEFSNGMPIPNFMKKRLPHKG